MFTKNYKQPVAVVERKQQALMFGSSKVQIWTFTPPQIPIILLMLALMISFFFFGCKCCQTCINSSPASTSLQSHMVWSRIMIKICLYLTITCLQITCMLIRLLFSAVFIKRCKAGINLLIYEYQHYALTLLLLHNLLSCCCIS